METLRNLLDRLTKYSYTSYEDAPYCGHYYETETNFWGFVETALHEGEGATRYGFPFLPYFVISTDGSKWIEAGTVLAKSVRRIKAEFKAIEFYLRNRSAFSGTIAENLTLVRSIFRVK